MTDDKRKKVKAARLQKTYKDYNWAELIDQNKLGKLTVPELHKYFDFHKLPTYDIVSKKKLLKERSGSIHHLPYCAFSPRRAGCNS